MVESIVVSIIWFIVGFNARPYWERKKAERAAVKARAESREKRSASAKEAAERRKIRAGNTLNATPSYPGQTASEKVVVNLNGSSNSYQPRDTEQQS